MRKPNMGVVGFGLISLGSTLFAYPASAAIDCGIAPSGGSLSQSGDYCQLRFNEPGDYTFTVPASANQLYALLVGGGAGATFDNGNSIGYAGSAGKVHYKDISEHINTQINAHVGNGGTGGTDSSTTMGFDSYLNSMNGLFTTSWGAQGTQTQSSATSCVAGTWTQFLSVGEGARTSTSLAATNGSCFAAQGKGVNPAQGDVDSAGTAVPAIFSNLNETFGTGGRITNSTASIPSVTYGDGGGFRVNISDNTFVGQQDNGGDGIIILRWRHVTPLANTGAITSELSTVALGLLALGSVLAISSRMRRRTAKKH
ncbi:MAG: hypothetical protein RI974_418 [Actinomycetota bacterium]|jgi:hypothetical protein